MSKEIVIEHCMNDPWTTEEFFNVISQHYKAQTNDGEIDLGDDIISCWHFLIHFDEEEQYASIFLNGDLSIQQLAVTAYCTANLIENTLGITVEFRSGFNVIDGVITTIKE